MACYVFALFMFSGLIYVAGLLGVFDFDFLFLWVFGYAYLLSLFSIAFCFEK